MWIPHFLWDYRKPESSSETIQASRGDTSKRLIEVEFGLKQPITHECGVEIRLQEAECRSITSHEGLEFKIRFDPGKDNRLTTIKTRAEGTSPEAIFVPSFEYVSVLLSYWTIASGCPCGIFGAKIVDVSHRAIWRVHPWRSNVEPLHVPAFMCLSAERAAMMSLYREARNSPSPFYHFLCCYKILEAWYSHGSIFGEVDRLIKEHNLPISRPSRRISKEMLSLSLLFKSRPEFQDVKFGQFFQLLKPWRVKIAHALTDAGEFVDLDKYDSHAEFGPVANLTDLVARQIMLDEIELWGQIEASGVDLGL